MGMTAAEKQAAYRARKAAEGKMERLQVLLPGDVKHQVEVRAAVERTSIGDILTRALLAFLAGPKDDPAPTPAQIKAVASKRVKSAELPVKEPKPSKRAKKVPANIFNLPTPGLSQEQETLTDEDALAIFQAHADGHVDAPRLNEDPAVTRVNREKMAHVRSFNGSRRGGRR